MKIQVIKVIALLVLSSVSHAQTITCKAQLIHTICGSGRIEISLDNATKKFKFHNGDVVCWMQDYELQGFFEKSNSAYPFYLDNTFQLSPIDEQTNQVIGHGSLIYDEKLKVARLEIAHRFEMETTNSKYDLTCD